MSQSRPQVTLQLCARRNLAIGHREERDRILCVLEMRWLEIVPPVELCDKAARVTRATDVSHAPLVVLMCLAPAKANHDPVEIVIPVAVRAPLHRSHIRRENHLVPVNLGTQILRRAARKIDAELRSSAFNRENTARKDVQCLRPSSIVEKSPSLTQPWGAR